LLGGALLGKPPRSLWWLSKGAPPEETLLKGSLSEMMLLEGTLLEGGMLPGGALPGGVLPLRPSALWFLLGGALPEESLPGLALPEGSLPETLLTGKALIGLLGGAPPSGTLPGMVLPEGALPGTTLPEALLPWWPPELLWMIGRALLLTSVTGGAIPEETLPA